MPEVSVFRLYLLRAMYLFMVVGLGTQIWPLIFDHALSWPLMNGVVCSMLGAVSILAAIGLRYPLQMLPVLFFEMIWKSIWLIAIALPLWLADQIDAKTQQTLFDCIPAIVIPFVVPWGYVYRSYVLKAGDRWR